MLNQNYDDVNDILNTLVTLGLVEPIDDPSLEVNYWDWAETVGIVDDLVPMEYTV